MIDTLAAYRDDGPLDEALRGIGARLRLPQAPAAFAGILCIAAGLLLDRGDIGVATGIGLGLHVLLAGLAGGTRKGRLRWLAPPLLRAAEYGFILALGRAAGADALPAVYGLLAAVAFRHYDIVYRLRHQRVTTPVWVGRLGLGWGGRMIAAYVLTVAGVLPAGAAVLAVALAVLFVSESVASWIGLARDTGRELAMATEDEDEE